MANEFFWKVSVRVPTDFASEARATTGDGREMKRGTTTNANDNEWEW